MAINLKMVIAFRKAKILKIKARAWKYLGTSKYRDSLDRRFGKEKRYPGRWTNKY